MSDDTLTPTSRWTGWRVIGCGCLGVLLLVLLFFFFATWQYLVPRPTKPVSRGERSVPARSGVRQAGG